MKELKLIRAPNAYAPSTLSANWTGPHSIQLCNQELRRAVSLPRGIKNITVVFSKAQRADDFDIVVRTRSCWLTGYGVDGRDFYFMTGARRYLRKMYCKGYRHVRVEYDD